jgi:DegV family protein with EDD domain
MKGTKRVKIVTDSTADIPAEMAERLEITIVPAYVIFGTESYRDGVELTKEQFYEKLALTGQIPSTAAPSPAAYERAYRELARETDEIVSIHLASRLSALYGVAWLAAQNMQVRVAVIDSEQVTMGCGWVAVAAAEAALRGASMEQIVHLVERIKERSWVLAALDTLDFLYRNGRVSWVKAMFGTLLRIKPIIEVRRGQVNLIERVRTQVRSTERLIDLVRNLGTLERAIVLHTNAPAAASRLADRLQALMPHGERLIAQAGVTVASHAGPGAIGIACVTAE